MNARFNPTHAVKQACLWVPLVLAAGGCNCLCNGGGCISPPGPMNYQQANAVVHDPFPQADLGPNDHSMRPPDYQNPLSLPVRNQTKTQVAPWLGP
ncbi:membrane or secreted protein [Stieleria sp. TO1_6]|uniref:membrane or secreted protein n=1 Tax=Stieleria tagensis TaxID=2956795 RepID=UPI00209B25DF|nr:membrane or secreted protein [Stieleria tagensis]MCO8120265.1 membrane or secreted protein [Stieleria tagensis]